MFPNTAGSSEHSATGTPWFNKTGNGCMGIDDAKRCPQPFQCLFVGNQKKKSYQNLIPKTIDEPFRHSQFVQSHLRNWTYFHRNAL
jgi:hypothetical protein